MKTTVATKKVDVLINRNFTLNLCGYIISSAGDFILITTLILWIATQLAYKQTWTALAISGVELAAGLSTLAVGPLAGVFVDRWDKRHTMLCMDLARGILILLLLVATGQLPAPFSLQLPLTARLVTIYLILLLVGACSQFFNPSRMALIGDIVAKEQRARAMGLSQAAFNSALILGPMLAAPLFMAFGARWAMLIDAASFFLSYLCILLIKTSPAAHSVTEHARRHYLHELWAGWKMIISNHILIALIVNGILMFAGAGTLNAFYMLFALTNLHTPTNLAGLFGPIYGAGVIFSLLLTARLARRLGEGKMLALATLAWGLMLMLLSRCTSFVPGLLVFGLLGAINGSTNVCIGPLILHLVPREFVGRFSAVLNPSITLSSMLSAALSGYLVSGPLLGLHTIFMDMNFGALDTVFVGAGLIGMLAGIYCIRTLGSVSTRTKIAEQAQEPNAVNA